MKEPLEKISNFLLDKKKENLKYNKQEIPDKLKYNSDDEESFNSKDNQDNNDININLKENEDKNNKDKNKEDIGKKEEKEKNPYELLLLKKIKSLDDNDDEKNKNFEIPKEEKENEKGKKIEEKIKEKENKENKYSSKTFSRNIENKSMKENNELKIKRKEEFFEAVIINKK